MAPLPEWSFGFSPPSLMKPFDFQSRTRLVFGEGAFERLGALAAELEFRRTLLVADRGIVGAGYVDAAAKILSKSNIGVLCFHAFDANPTSAMAEAGRAFCADSSIDSLIG